MKGFGKLISWLKKLFKKEKKCNKGFEFNFLEEGDVFWAYRYKNESEKENIPDGHRSGPFVVLKKSKSNLFILSITSTVGEDGYYKLDRFKYNLPKESYVNLKFISTLCLRQYMKKLFRMDYYDFNNLKKEYYLYTKRRKKSILNLKKIKFDISKGDVIDVNNRLYYVVDVTRSGFNCYRVYRSKNIKFYPVLIGSFWFYFDFNTIIELNKSNNVLLVGRANNVKNEIVKAIKKRLDSENLRISEGRVERGNVICKNNKLYYVYGEYKNNFLVFEIFSTQIKKGVLIKVKNESFYTKFNDEEISRNDSLKIKAIANLFEIENIKAKRKSYKIKYKK